MRFTVNRQSLAKTVAVATTGLPTRDINPVLTNFLVSAADGRVTLQATNLEHGVSADVGGTVTVDVPGQALVPAEILQRSIRESRGEDVSFSATTNKIHVTCGTAKFDFRASDPLAFPPYPDLPDEMTTLATPSLATALRRVAFCAAEKAEGGGKYVVTGVLVDFSNPEKLLVVAMDGNRLGKAYAPRSANSVSGTAIVPARFFVETAPLIKCDETKLGYTQSDFHLTCDDFKAYTRLIEGRYPPYQKMEEFFRNTHSFDATAEDLLRCVAQASVTATAEYKRINFQPSAGKLRVVSVDSEYGRSESEITIAFDGTSQPVSISVNSDLPKEMLRLIQRDGEVSLKVAFSESHESALFFHDADSYTYIVMPLVDKAAAATSGK